MITGNLFLDLLIPTTAGLVWFILSDLKPGKQVWFWNEKMQRIDYRIEDMPWREWIGSWFGGVR